MNPVSAISTPADFPHGARLWTPPGQSLTIRSVLATVRPDIAISDRREPESGQVVLLTGPRWREVAAAFAESGYRVFVMPEHATSYFDFWSMPVGLIHRTQTGKLAVAVDDFHNHMIAVAGGFFGCWVAGRYEPEPCRYRTFDPPDANYNASKERVLSSLDDEASRRDYLSALDDQPADNWRRWLRGLYNGIEYMDYAQIRSGDVVMNCGVHGGGELPGFLAELGAAGTIVNVDPLGQDYLQPFVKEAIADFPGRVIEVRAALSDGPGSLDIPVEPGGMAVPLVNDPHGEGLRHVRVDTLSVGDIIELLGLTRLDYIKMDIEGAEGLAVPAAIAAIRKFRPQLAIAIYHQPSHFVDLPLTLIDHLEDYRFYVRAYHFISNEVVFYAIPNERMTRPRSSIIEVDLIGI